MGSTRKKRTEDVSALQERQLGYEEMKRPNLLAIKALLESIDKANNHRARFSEIAFATPLVRNRTATSEYLKFLEDLGWVEWKTVEQYVKTFRVAHLREGKMMKNIGFYNLTDKGRVLLTLFPQTESEAA